ncbi:hypothetical protein [uncultured Lutibacter sp.]|uniref:DUF7670 domain-containing protein n=1 Tax=uncultured Lutibacter sp. TaxID=437739 RepID=UPI0026049282|nr:hypothetical protein [uncultured Lutibacter sp.]
MKSKSNKTLLIVTAVYALLYLTGMITSIFKGEFSLSNPIDNYFLILSIIFMIGFLFSWTRKKIAGIIFLVWNAGVWIFDFYLSRSPDSGMIIVLALPILFIGSFFLLEWYKSSETPKPKEQQQWKFILRILLVNYAILYIIVVFSDLSIGESIDYFNLPFILYPLLLILFFVGFALSWKREFYAGFMFLVWYLILLFGFITYSEFLRSGPWIIAGIVILLQGIIYIKHHYEYRLQ